jgi:hypothetical protein
MRAPAVLLDRAPAEIIALVPYFQALSTAQSECGKFGVESGSDGTRTRDLCRDRAAL